MKLNWEKILHYSKITAAEHSKPGIYIWGFFENKNFMPYYVGKAAKVGERLYSHLSSLKCGSYTIYTPLNLFNVREDKRLYEPDSIDKKIEFVSGKMPPVIYENASRMVDEFHFTWAPMSNNDFIEWSNDAEKTILNLFKGKNIIIDTRFGTPEKILNQGNLSFDGEKYIKVL